MKQLITVLIILGIGIATVVYLNLTEKKGEIVEPKSPVASVEVITIEKSSPSITLTSQGTVLPEIEIDLPIEVSGRIIEVGENFKVGNRFNEGEILLRIDPADYEVALASAKAEVARAKLSLAQEIAQAEQAAEDWTAFGHSIGSASSLTLRKPQLQQARAILESAKATLKQAERNLDRTLVRAPFDGYILSKSVDRGQFATAAPSGNAARIFSAARAEIRLPLTEHQLSLLGNKLGTVKLSADSAGTNHIWEGRLVRVEATVDPNTRLNYVVAQIDAPFEAQPKLRRGRFVQASIQGRTIPDAVELPSYALRSSDTVYVMTRDDSLHTRKVSVLFSDANIAIITDGLAEGEKVATSPIAFFVEGMPVMEITAP